MLRHISQKNRDDLVSQIKTLQKKINALPSGNLICARSGPYTKWYLSNGHRPTYLSKKKRPRAEALALKKYYLFQKDELEKELKLVDSYLRRHDKIHVISAKMLEETSRYNELLKPNFLEREDLPSWFNTTYSPSENHSENLIHKTFAGHKVRSKSEVIIANALFTNRVFYRYEFPFNDHSTIIYPDFTICHPQTKETFYWEHFGMMDNVEYRDRAYNKLKIYGNNDIIPSINLITTFETRTRPVDSEEIQRIIQTYFL